MNAPANWHEANADYLSAALAGLRLRLEWLATVARAAHETAGAGERADDGTAPGQQTADALPRAAQASEQTAAEASSRNPVPAQTGVPDYTERGESRPSLLLLAQCFGLSRFEQDVLLLCAAMELDTQMAGLCARAQYPAARPYPTFALALALFDDAAWDALSPQRPLRYWHLIETDGDTAQPLTVRALHIDERIVSYIKGLNYVDERLDGLLLPVLLRGATTALQPSQQAALAQAVAAWERLPDGAPLPLLQLAGQDPASKVALACHVAEHFGCQVQRVCVDALADRASDLDMLARLTQRECMLSPLALYFDWPDTEAAGDIQGQGMLRRFFTRSEGLFFIDTREPLARLGRASVCIDVARPTPAEQGNLWHSALQGRANPGVLAAQFSLDAAQIERIAAQALQDAPAGDAAALSAALWDACSASVRPALNRLAQRLDGPAGWDDLVVPPEQQSLLRQISAQVAGRAQVYETWGFARKMNRGLGISALFCGDSGTGKTLAAEVIANDLRLNLYRIDLSAVVSKYIGETEGNLRRLFDAAEDGGAILFFDECDALFGKRSEVRDSHDRYANMEINYLLQRIESYRGLAILATNMRNALDPAFVRRLRFIVNFPFPGHAERRQIWQKAFPADLPRDALDLERLARFNLSGGNIHGAALNAAFLAAHAGHAVRMADVCAAVRAELIKLGRPVNEADFQLSAKKGATA
jgi:hypothetical protein